MRRILLILVSVLSAVAFAEAPEKAGEKKAAKEAELGKKETSIAPDKSLAGDVTRKKKKEDLAPALQYDQFRLGVEGQVNTKRKEQISDLVKIIELSTDKGERPKLLFRLGELYWEESKFYFFEANRFDDEYIKAMNANDKAGMERAKASKEAKLEESKGQAKLAVDQYSEIIQKHKDFERNDEVLYFLGQNLMEMNDEKKALVAYKRLIDKYPKSKYLPDAYLAFGEYYFNGSKGKRDQIEKALASYKDASKFTENAVYGYALYKQGWCYFNLGDYEKAMDMYKAVILYARFAGDSAVEGEAKKGGKGQRAGLVKEARQDFVRAYARLLNGNPSEGRERFSKLVEGPTQAEDLRTMMKGLANLYYDDGKDKEAALGYDMLIKERPLSPESPGFQGKIIDCVMRAGNKRMTVQQVRRLVKITDDVLAAVKGKCDKKCDETIIEAKELAERTISNLAVNWHNEGKKTRDEETFGFANEVYADYMALFPDSPKAYDLRFFWAELLNDNLNKYDKAAEQYTTVLGIDIAKGDKCQAPPEKDEKGKDKAPPCKWMTNAAYNSILAFDEVVKTANLKPPALVDPTKKLDIPPQKKALLDACEKYIKYVPKGEKQVEIAYKAAKIYYDYNDLDQAVPRFADIALKHPDYKFENGDKAGEIAANLVLDSYNLLADWSKVNEWARKFYAEEKLAVGKFREDLAKLIEQSSFKLVNQLEGKKDYAKAAEAYLGFVAEFPKSEIADKALFNASIDFFNGRMLDKAIETRKRIIHDYPKSQYVPLSMFALADGYEAIADFENAADYYEAYANAYEKSIGKKGAKKAPPPPPKKAAKGKGGKEKEEAEASKDAEPSGAQIWEEGKAQIALFNSGIFRDGLGAYKQALHDREKYLEIWPDSKDAEAVFLSIVDLHERNGQWMKAIKQIEDFEKKYCSKDPNKMLTQEGRIATIWEEKLKNPKGARKVFDRIFDFHEKLSKKVRATLEISALDAVARAHFVKNEDEWKKFQAVKLKWSKLTNIGELKGSIQAKSKALDGIQKIYTTTVGFKSADPAICALYRIGMAYDDFSKAMVNIPIPKGAPDDLLAEVKLQFEQQAQPLKDKAAEAFAATVGKSQELAVFNPCTEAALQKLRTEYKPEAYPKMGEDKMEMKLEGFKGIALGDDLLLAIQVPPATGGDLNSKAREVSSGKDVADLNPKNPPKDLNPTPTPAPAPKKNTPVAEPQKKVGTTEPPKKKESGGEPDEPL